MRWNFISFSVHFHLLVRLALTLGLPACLISTADYSENINILRFTHLNRMISDSFDEKKLGTVACVESPRGATANGLFW